MFNDLLNDTVVVRFPRGTYSDGKPDFAEHEVRAFVFDYNERLFKEIGLVKNAKFFVIAANEVTRNGFAECPVGAQVVHDSKTYDLKTVKASRNLDGEIECYSCAGV